MGFLLKLPFGLVASHVLTRAWSGGVTYKNGLTPSWLFPQSCNHSSRCTDRPRKWRHHFNQSLLWACAWSQSWKMYKQTGCDKRKYYDCKSTKSHLHLVVAPANLCLACKPHLTLLQANTSIFSYSFYHTVQLVGIKTHRVHWSKQGTGRQCKKHLQELYLLVKSKCKITG